MTIKSSYPPKSRFWGIYGLQPN